MNRTFRLLALATTLPLALGACSSGTHDGDTNVEKGSAKAMESNSEPSRSDEAASSAAPSGDSLAAGIPRDTSNRPTGRELFDNAAKSKDKNHDGLAD